MPGFRCDISPPPIERQKKLVPLEAVASRLDLYRLRGAKLLFKLTQIKPEVFVMKKLYAGLFLGFLLAVPSTAFAQLSAFQGNWRNNDPATQGVTRLQIQTSPNVTVHAWGKCSPTDCDNGRP